MGKGVFLSKALAVTCAVVAVAAAATIIALAVVYAQEKSKNEVKPTSTATPITTTTPSTPKEPWDHYRLPKSLSPVSYNVTLRPRLKPNANGLYIFTGESTVVFKCVKETDLIIIHSNKLNLTNFDGFLAKLMGLNGATAPNLKKT
ncbi:Aminopeptidase N, partial [Dissostichus eleginoides]